MQPQPIGMAPQQGMQGSQGPGGMGGDANANSASTSWNVMAREFVPGGPQGPAQSGPGLAAHQGGGGQMGPSQIGGPGPGHPNGPNGPGPGQGNPSMKAMPGPMGPGYPMNPQMAAQWEFRNYGQGGGYPNAGGHNMGMQPMPRRPGANQGGGPQGWGAGSARGQTFPDAWGPQMGGPNSRQFDPSGLGGLGGNFGPGAAPGLALNASQGDLAQQPSSPHYLAMWNVASGHGEDEIRKELEEIDFVPSSLTKLEGLEGAFALRYDEEYMAAAITIALDNTQGHVQDCGEKLRLVEYVVENGGVGAHCRLKGDGVPGEVQNALLTAMQRLTA